MIIFCRYYRVILSWIIRWVLLKTRGHECFKPTPVTQSKPQQLNGVAPPAMSCCPSQARSFVSNGWRSLLPSPWQDQIKRCTEDGWAQSEWKIGGQAQIFPVSCPYSPLLFAAFCQIDDVRGKYYLFCFHCWFCPVLLRVAISILMTERRNEAKVADLLKCLLYWCCSTPLQQIFTVTIQDEMVIDSFPLQFDWVFQQPPERLFIVLNILD